MNYQETLDYLFNALPMFQRIGAAAFKKDLGPTMALCGHLGNPQRAFKSIHVAGTNGKGSTSHALASILQEQGYKVGLYTSPHLKSFTERIRVDGLPICEKAVVDFVAQNKEFLEQIKPSFFEMTVALAFDYFAREKVDIAVVEVGMGGRLDSTNVLLPILCVITNIGMDHMQFLGDTLPEIAAEKAGIIKTGIPVIIGTTQEETEPIFTAKAHELKAPIYFADRRIRASPGPYLPGGNERAFFVESSSGRVTMTFGLAGDYQAQNLPAILMAAEMLPQLGLPVSSDSLERGLRNLVPNTGLKGRWQRLNEIPLTICDTGHNEDAFKVIIQQIKQLIYKRLWIILGLVKDKDVGSVLSLLPTDATYVFCQATIPRAMTAQELANQAGAFGLLGEVIEDVNEALNWALQRADDDDLIYVGGSTFVVAEIANL
ncbi:bifunctional folylpolyglutamate synthase/dihydrofolate synthase [Lunatimonas salinarum]|uniref:bifunctional folylpolyglutamate synthase/dihydrofolate synthase n=1 Tax=Lunatimonas salinarum TaxID=1774590 RepID=UPI001ADFA0DA|nr:folylpolyglutamate synthase/dihydrofolate synthase family protein [Lunatimonas salinarum]